MKIDEMEFKTEELRNFSKKLLKNDFKVYTTKHQPTTYIKFVKNNNIGYAQDDYFGGLNLSTVHKPNHRTGTGYRLHETGIEDPTIKQAEQTFINMPYWAHGTLEDIQKYKNWEEYKKLETVLKFIEITED